VTPQTPETLILAYMHKIGDPNVSNSFGSKIPIAFIAFGRTVSADRELVS
jgi:hypothetical protein